MRRLCLLLLLLVAAGCGGSSAPSDAAARPKADRFDSARAFALLRRQVELGPRPAGSATLKELARILRRKLPNGRFDSVEGHPGLRNVVGRLPGRRPAVVLAAHYDTKDSPEGFVGAEDGAGGTAAVVEVARRLRRMRRPANAREVRFVLFDGEECPEAEEQRGTPFLQCGVRGSTAYAKQYGDQVGQLVLLDFIAQKDLSIPRDASSDQELWAKLRDAARAVGTAGVFPDETQGDIQDDHTPFIRRGIPAIDLIDFDFDCWHELCDDMTAVSERSLDRSGEAVLELMRRLRAGR